MHPCPNLAVGPGNWHYTYALALPACPQPINTFLNAARALHAACIRNSCHLSHAHLLSRLPHRHILAVNLALLHTPAKAHLELQSHKHNADSHTLLWGQSAMPMQEADMDCSYGVGCGDCAKDCAYDHIQIGLMLSNSTGCLRRTRACRQGSLQAAHTVRVSHTRHC